MALEHAILVSLHESSGSGIELTRKFDRSIGFFWHATHQQIYRVLARMQSSGWVSVTEVEHADRPVTKVYAPTAAGSAELERWLAEPLAREQFRSDVAVKLRGASHGDRAALLAEIESLRTEHEQRLALYEELAARRPADPTALELDQYLVLRGGLLQEQFWIQWLTEYLDAHRTSTKESA